jgi:hypothetical protein
MESGDFLTLLLALSSAGVEFVLVGGLAAALNGATNQTIDLDIVPARNEGNLTKLLNVLDSVDAIFRIQPSRRMKPNMSHLQSIGHKNLITRFGPLDVLGTIGRGLSYEDLLPHSIEMEIGDGVRVRVLDLATIIAIKEELGSEKDLAVLPLLRRALKDKPRPS